MLFDTIFITITTINEMANHYLSFHNTTANIVAA